MVYLAEFAGRRKQRLSRMGTGGSSKAKIIKHDRREHVIHEVMDILDDFRLSPWENEGSTRAGLRSALCLLGHDWQDSDSEAEGIITVAFRRLGTPPRPSWEEGQREYSTPRENCNWCKADLEQWQIDRSERFCSFVCAKAALVYRQYQTHWHQDSMGRKANEILQKSKTRLRTCRECGEAYHPLREGSTQIYCSIKCRDSSMRTVPERDCLQCGTSFRGDRMSRFFCQPVCAATYRFQNAKIEKHCQCCQKPFEAKISTAMYCSNACKKRAFKARQRESATVIYLTPAVFDSWFRKAA